MPTIHDSSVVDLAALRKLREDKLITIQEHPEFPLLIFNYSQVCQYEKAWNDLTTMCRGLITDLEGRIIARPFRKFFNLSEHQGEESKLPPINWKQDFYVSEKLDGSLGILYPTPNGLRIATRGSFISDQAKRGMEIFNSKGYSRYPFDAGRLTYLFEIIYPENRIVVDYGGMEDLILLDVVDIRSGMGLPHSELQRIAQDIGCPVAQHLPEATAETLSNYTDDNKNREGVVVRFEDGTRIKIKLEEYCRLHKLITGVNARRIWECLMNGSNMDELLDRVPDEFYDWVQKTKAELTGKYAEIESECKTIITAGDQSWTQKEWALYFLKPETKHLSGVLFSMLKGKGHSPVIWKMIKPAHAPPFKDDEA